MAEADAENVTAKHLARASVVTSLLLLTSAALQLNVMFWVLVMLNFVLMHAVWLIQLPPNKRATKVDFALVKGPLIAFGVLGNLALLLWGERLLAVFPT